MDFAKYESLPEWLSDLPMSKGRIVFPELGIDLPYRKVARRAAGFADILRRNGATQLPIRVSLVFNSRGAL